jgi:hypothetical protein
MPVVAVVLGDRDRQRRAFHCLDPAAHEHAQVRLQVEQIVAVRLELADQRQRQPVHLPVLEAPQPHRVGGGLADQQAAVP